MKLSQLSKLLRLSKVKSDAEKARFQAVSSAQAASLAAAKEHAKKSAAPYEPADDQICGGDLSAYGHYLRRHDRAEKVCRRAAHALEAEKQSRRLALARSLGEQAAWSRLHSGARAELRKKANDTEEVGRGDLIAQESSSARQRK